MNKMFLCAIMCFVGLNGFAEFDQSADFEIDGIFYYLDNQNHLAQVGPLPNGRYSGDIFIPSSIYYNNKTYSVTSIKEYAFCWCSNLTSVIIPNSVTNIANAVFWGSNNLTTIRVAPDNPKYDSRNNCNAIIETSTNVLIVGCKSTIIPNSVIGIGDEAFRECDRLTSITIPYSVTNIGNFVFWRCRNLVSVTIPEGVTSIGYNPFWACSSLSSIIVAQGNLKYDSRNNSNAIIETSTNKLISGCKNTIIPTGVNTIEHGAFCGCVELDHINIPFGVANISSQAFYDCINLSSVSIPESVAFIGDMAFSGCNKLKTVTIPGKVKLGRHAFGEATQIIAQ